MFIFAILPDIPTENVEEILSKFKSIAIHIKVESTLKRGGAVRIEDVLTALKSIKESYKHFIDVKYEPLNTQAQATKYKKQMERIEGENDLFIVDLDFKSFGATVAPNTSDYAYKIPHVDDTIKWKKDAFKEFKRDVFHADYNNEAFLKRIIDKYTPLQRNLIYNPIVKGLIENKDLKIKFGTKPTHLNAFKATSNTLKKVAPELKNEEPKAKDEKFLATAQVEVSSLGTKPKVIDIFEDASTPVLKFDQINFDGRTYKFAYPLYYELVHENDFYSFESHQFGIYVQGKTREEATVEFSEEFDYIYNRYNELADDKLTEDVIRIKQALNSLVLPQ